MVLLDHGGRDPEEFNILAPPTDLSGVVQHVWVKHRMDVSVPWRVVPDTSPHLIATVTAPAQERTIRVAVVGARSCAADIDVRHRVLTVGLRLRVGALPILTNASAREFVDRGIPIEQVFGPRMLRDLELSPDAPPALILQQLIRLARRAFRQRTTRTMPFDSARAVTVAELAREVDTPTRSLRELAHHQVGLSPKRMLRVLRLHAALYAARRPGRSWSDVAYMAGYADQPHLTRELRALLGETPSAWKARGSADSFKTAALDVR